jgi:hypothetical protein
MLAMQKPFLLTFQAPFQPNDLSRTAPSPGEGMASPDFYRTEMYFTSQPSDKFVFYHDTSRM